MGFGVHTVRRESIARGMEATALVQDSCLSCYRQKGASNLNEGLVT